MNDLLALMHDTMGRVATIKGAVNILRDEKISIEDKTKLLNAIETRANELNEVLDNYYVKSKI